MKKSLLGALFTFALMFTPIDTQAASTCSYAEQAELNEIANNVKVNYEVVDLYDGQAYQLDSGLDEDPLVDIYVRGFKINILNITEDILVRVTNDFDNIEYTYDSKNIQDGIGTFETKNNEELVKYTINIYSNKGSCTGDLVRSFKMVTPAYNLYSSMALCDDYPQYYYCQEFLPTGSIEYITFSRGLDKYIEEIEDKKKEEEEEKNKNIFEKIKDFYIKNKIIVNIGVIIVIASGIVVTTIVLVKKKRGRVL